MGVFDLPAKGAEAPPSFGEKKGLEADAVQPVVAPRVPAAGASNSFAAPAAVAAPASGQWEISALSPEDFSQQAIVVPLVKASRGGWMVDDSDVLALKAARDAVAASVLRTRPQSSEDARQASARSGVDAILSRPLHDDIHYTWVPGCALIFVKKDVLARMDDRDLLDRVHRHAVDRAIRTGGVVNPKALAYFQSGGARGKGGAHASGGH